jgi:uncharacterized membrane protein
MINFVLLLWTRKREYYLIFNREIAIPRYKDELEDEKVKKVSPKTIIKRTITVLSVVGIISSVFWYYYKNKKEKK